MCRRMGAERTPAATALHACCPAVNADADTHPKQRQQAAQTIQSLTCHAALPAHAINAHRCFDETRSGAFDVITAGGWFPRAVAGRLVALCALVRCCLVALAMARAVARGAAGPYDALFVDQVAGVVPLLRLLLPRSKLLFYCHFPDLLLSTQRTSVLKRAYRVPLDQLEESATGAADALLVNSRFTAGRPGLLTSSLNLAVTTVQRTMPTGTPTAHCLVHGCGFVCMMLALSSPPAAQNTPIAHRTCDTPWCVHLSTVQRHARHTASPQACLRPPSLAWQRAASCPRCSTQQWPSQGRLSCGRRRAAGAASWRRRSLNLWRAGPCCCPSTGAYLGVVGQGGACMVQVARGCGSLPSQCATGLQHKLHAHPPTQPAA